MVRFFTILGCLLFFSVSSFKIWAINTFPGNHRSASYYLLTVPSSNIIINTVTVNSFKINWTNGNGTRRVVFVKQTNSQTEVPVPVDGITYTANTVFESGTQLGTGWYCVFNSNSGTSVSVTNLNSSLSYRVVIFDYDGTGAATQYNKTLNLAGNPVNTAFQSNNISFSNVLPTSMSLSWVNGNATKRAVFIKETTNNEVVPLIDNTTYTANTTFGFGSETDLWYCVYNGTGTTVNVVGLTSGKTYRVMVCDYWGNPGSEAYITYGGVNNPNSITTNVQASNVVISNVQAASFDVSWYRGTGDSCTVFVKQASGGTASPEDGSIYTANSTFGAEGQIGNTSWFCVYKGKGSSTTVNGINSALPYQIMVCEYVNNSGIRYYNKATATGNPSYTNIPTQSTSITFANLLSTSATINWKKGGGSKRAVFIKQTTDEVSALPVSNTTYSANTTFGSGSQIGTSGWYCVYNGTDEKVNVYGLTPRTSYRVMVCEYNGIVGMEQYNTTSSLTNPVTLNTILQASNINFSNLQPGSIDVSWSRGTGDSCIVFIKQTDKDSPYPVEDINYTANTSFGFAGSQLGTSGWYCVYKGKGTSTTITGLTTTNIYRVMVCEYVHSGAIINYVSAIATNNPLNTPTKIPTSQAKDIVFQNITSANVTVKWSNGNGSNRVVFMKETSGTESAAPLNETTYTANQTFANGSQIGTSGWFCVYNGTGSSTVVSGLTPGKTYRAMVCEYNINDGTEGYNTSTTSNNPKSSLITIQANNVLLSNIQITSMDLSWTRGTGDSCAVFVQQNSSAGSANPSNGIVSKPNSVFGSAGTQIGTTGWYCVYTGTGTSVSITGINSELPYNIMVCEFNNSSTVTYNNSTSANNPISKPGKPVKPTEQAYRIVFSNLTSTAMNINWSRGKGANCAVFIKQTSSFESASPVNNTTYNANNVYGNGDQIGTSGWYCVYKGSDSKTTVSGLTSGFNYIVMVCEYNGISGNEFYNTDLAIGNPASIQLNTQASAISFSNLQLTSTDITWIRGNCDGCVVFAQQGNSGSATLNNFTTYTPSNVFGAGSGDGTGWYCIYKGTGNSTSLTGLMANKDYRVMVCEYTGPDGDEIYNTSTSSGNPANIPNVKPNQSTNIYFSNITASSASISWSIGSGTKRVVFMKKTTGNDSPSLVNGIPYTPNTLLGYGSQIGTSGWYCVYNGMGNSVTVNGLVPGETYKAMVCDYVGISGSEIYNTDLSSGNPAFLQLNFQASNIVFNNVLQNSMTVNWTRGTGEACIVFVKQGNSGNISLGNDITYTANSDFGKGTNDGTGWYCVYKGTANSVSISGLKGNLDYRVMVCEYKGSPGNEKYNQSIATNNPANKPLGPGTQASNIIFNNVLPSSATISWTNGNGSKRAVFMKETDSEESVSPSPNTTYMAHSTYGNGDQVDVTGWYCIYNGSGSSTNVFGISNSKTYRVKVCEYNGNAGGELYNTEDVFNNPSSSMISIQASNISYSNLLPTSMDLQWSRGTGDSCAVFIKQASTGYATPINGNIYDANPAFSTGSQIGNSGWYCVYKGKGTAVTVTDITSTNAYQIMVCEFSTIGGVNFYNTSSTAINNPVNRPAAAIAPSNQAFNMVFSNVTLTSATASWTNGNGIKRAVFIKETIGLDNAVPENNKTYTANTTFNNGTQIGSSGWYCIYNGTNSNVNVFGLEPGKTYRVSVCEYNGNNGFEQYNTSVASYNPSSLKLIVQASNVTVSNIQPTSLNLSWMRGTGDSCAVFIKLANSGNVYPVNGEHYKANGTYLIGSQVGTSGWYCVYKGKGTNTTIAGLNTNEIYRVMVCEYTNSGAIIQYNNSSAQDNPINTLPSLPSQASNIVFKNITSNYLTLNWTNGNGSNRVVFMKKTSSLESASPFGKSYIANTNFGKGSEIDASGWYCVYNGNGNSVNVFDLTEGSSYCVSVCEYNGSLGNEQYNISSSVNNPASIQLILQASNINITNIQPSSMDLSWSRGLGDSCAVFVKQATSGNAVPVNGIIYKDNTYFTSGSQIESSGWYCVYKGTGTNTTVTGLLTSNAYQIMVCEFTQGGINSFYNTSTAINNPVNKPALPIKPGTQATNISFSNSTINSVNVSWSNGNGTGRLVFVRQTPNLEFPEPVNNITYDGNTNFGSGDQIGSTEWYCVYNGTGNSTVVNNLTAGNIYRIMVCEYNGYGGLEIYNNDLALGNPASILLNTQASNINISNVQPTSMNITWDRGNGNECIVFAKQGTSGNVTLNNFTTYTPSSIFGKGSPDGTGWFCIFKGTGNNVSVNGLTENLDYRVMVCEYNGSAGSEVYNTSSNTGNPAQKPLIPINQASNITFSSFTTNAMTVSWSNNGSKRVVFMKETTGLERPEPINNTLYTANATFGTGTQIGTSGWFCIANGTMSSVTVTSLTAGKTYRVMVCEYTGNPGNELYNKNFNTNNPNSAQLTIQSSNIIFSNVQPNSTDITWTKGTGTGCVVFVKQATSGSVTLLNNVSYQANSTFGLGSPDGTGWFCVYNGTGNTASINGLIADKDYRVMVCEYIGTTGNEQYNTSTASGNPDQKPVKPLTQAYSISFTSITNNSMTLSWTNGNGTKRAVFVRQTSANEIPSPENNHTYAAHTTFGTGDQINTTGWYCVYNSNSSSTVTVNNLTSGATYKVMVCEYKGAAGVEQYNTDLAINNPAGVTLTTQSKNIQFRNIQPTSMTVSWTKGSETGRIVFMTQANSGSVILNDGDSYTPSSNFGSGDPAGIGWFCVYKGTGTSVNITGLTPNKDYRVMVCEYNGTPGNEKYNNSSAEGNPANNTMPPTNPANNLTFSNIFVGKATISWTRGNGSSCAVFAKKTTSTVESAAPDNNITYVANSDFGSGTQIGSTDWFCIYKGTNTSVTITNLIGGETYRVMVCEFNGVNGGELFTSNTALNNPKSFSTITSKTDQTITFNNIDPRQYGVPDFNPGATTTSGLPIVYTSSNLSVAIIVAGKIHIVGMGTTTITASQPGNIDYTPATPVDRTLTVEMGTQGINFAPLTAKYYGDPDFDPGAVASSGLPVSYSSNNPSVAVIVNNKVRIVGVGTTTISAFQPGNSNYYPASSVFQNLTVYKKNQTITFNPLPAKTFKDSDFDPGATASSGLLVTYTSSNTNIATIVGGRVHIVGAGVVNILASQEGNAWYGSAPIVPRTLTINKADQEITFQPLADIVYEDIYLNPAFSNSDLDIVYISDNTNVAEIVNGKIHIVGAGTVNITATQPGNTNYNAAPDISQSLTVTKQDQTINFNLLPSAVIGDPDITPSAEASSALEVIFSSDNTGIATIVNGKIHIVGTGTCNIIASQPGDNRYNPALTTVSQPFTVINANQLITFGSIPAKTYGDGDFALTANASSGLSVTFTSDNPSVATVTAGGTVHIVNAGVANITASQAGDGTYNRAPYVVQPLLINKAAQSITFGALPVKVYDDPDLPLTATSSSGLSVSYLSDNNSVATIVNDKIHIVGAGTANIYALQPGNSNYLAANSVAQPFTVSKISQSIIFAAIPSKTYTDPDFNPGAVSSTGLPITYSSSNENVAIVVGDKIHIVGLGTTTITATQNGNSNYLPVTASQSFSVTKSSQTITFNALATRPYGSPDFNLTAIASSGLDIAYTSSNPAVATVTNGRVHIVGVGSTLILATQSGNAFFNSTSQAQTLIVTKASQTITFAPIPEQIYENGDYLLEAESSSGLSVNFTTSNISVATINYGWLHIVSAGTVTVTASQPGNSLYSAATNVSQVIVIRKKTQQIYFDTIPEKTYGDADFDPDAVTSSGLNITYTSNNPQVAIIVNGKVRITGAGNANITATLNGTTNYYPAESIVKLLVVKKATLQVSADDKIRKFNTDNPAFTYSITGFVNGDDPSSIDSPPIILTAATKESYPGSYEIIPQNASDNNYNFIYQKGILTILGTSPLKPLKPAGNTLLCINSDDQTYTTPGGVFATSYVWELKPSKAGTISGAGTVATVNFDDNFTGKASITVKGKSLELSESSDTLHVTIIPKLSIPEVNCRGSYCSNSIYGDSILIPISPEKYKFQLYQENTPIGFELTGTGAHIGWYDLKSGTYSITEKLCNLDIKTDILIKEVTPNSSKPQVSTKWNDVLVCVKGEDSIIAYKWYKDGRLIKGENKQFLWTNQKEGKYAVKTTDFSGCDFTSDEIAIEPSTKGLVFPNPNHGQFEVSFSSGEKGSVTVKISSMKSLSVKSLSFNKNTEEFKKDINLQGITPGVYFVDVSLNGKRIFYEKIIVD